MTEGGYSSWRNGSNGGFSDTDITTASHRATSSNYSDTITYNANGSTSNSPTVGNSVDAVLGNVVPAFDFLNQKTDGRLFSSPPFSFPRLRGLPTCKDRPSSCNSSASQRLCASPFRSLLPAPSRPSRSSLPLTHRRPPEPSVSLTRHVGCRDSTPLRSQPSLSPTRRIFATPPIQHPLIHTPAHEHNPNHHNHLEHPISPPIPQHTLNASQNSFHPTISFFGHLGNFFSLPPNNL